MKVSVIMTTHNHEKYIAQAIESVLMQQVSFDYEPIIGEDASIDGTPEIVLDYQRRYPGIVRPLLHDKEVSERDRKRGWVARRPLLKLSEPAGVSTLPCLTATTIGPRRTSCNARLNF